MEYVELHARSAFSFLRGASSPEDLVRTTGALGLGAVAVCDRDGVYGSARAHATAREAGIRAIVGAELTLDDETILPVLVESQTGYRNLCRLITSAKLRGTKHSAPVSWQELREHSDGLFALTGSADGPLAAALDADDPQRALEVVNTLTSVFGAGHVAIEVQRHLQRGEKQRLQMLRELAGQTGVMAVATNGVRYATPDRRPLLDVMTCSRHGVSLDDAGILLECNAERYLKSDRQMRRLFDWWPEVVDNSGRIAEQLEFSLENLGYTFPTYAVPDGETMDSFLRRVTFAGARARYSHLSRKVLNQLNHELALIAKLGFSGYFLIVWDLANFCSEQNILMQGRGSAANSAVCYSLGITACDPVGCGLLFERFLSEGRKSWPDIDLDLPSGARRERVIQEVFRRYGPYGAAMTANVITYRGRSAMREIGKAMNFPQETIDRFSKLYASGDFPHTLELHDQMRQSGIAMDQPRALAAAQCYRQLYGLPRHLGQHSGGMVICNGALSTMVPLERAAMPGRVVVQWDKDDCEDLGIIKVDLLGLGMMAVLQDTMELCSDRGRAIDLAAIPKDDAATFEMIRAADTIGVFQIESRAQMATLPRMKPRVFYDLVVEVAIIRPGPIQGGLVHPYLARRNGEEPVTYFDPRLEPVLARTLGVPLFQEQLLKMAMVMADFSGSEAEELRRALSFHRSQERMEAVCIKLRANMQRNTVPDAIADQIVQSVQSFAVYGFPESHAISFALIAYASAWLKVHRTAEFFAALLNNQPMGFYSASTLIQDAKSHGLTIYPVSVTKSAWFTTVENDSTLRLGLLQIRGLRHADGDTLVAARNTAEFASIEDFQSRVPLHRDVLRSLARAGAFDGLGGHRRDALWKVERKIDPDEIFATEATRNDPSSPLKPMDAMDRLHADFQTTGVTTGPHPMELIRDQHTMLWKAKDLAQAKPGTRVQIGGLVICRQRPGTAKGNVFISVEDESGVANAIVSPDLFESRRLCITQESFLCIGGMVQSSDGVVLIQAREISPLQSTIHPGAQSHDFH